EPRERGVDRGLERAIDEGALGEEQPPCGQHRSGDRRRHGGTEQPVERLRCLVRVATQARARGREGRELRAWGGERGRGAWRLVRRRPRKRGSPETPLERAPGGR